MLHLSSVTADQQPSGVASFVLQVESVGIGFRSVGCPLLRELNSKRATRGLSHRISSQKCRASPSHRPRKQRFRVSGVPQCLADSSEVARRSGRPSPDVVLGSSRATDGVLGLNSHSVDADKTTHNAPPWTGNCAFRNANTVGILGGLAPLATVEFMRKIVEASTAEDENGHMPVILCSEPYVPQKNFRSVAAGKTNGSAFSSGTAPKPDFVSVEALLEKRRFLEQSGAKCIVMPCHISHVWYEQLSEGCSVPFLHMADCVIEELKDADLRPLEGGSKPKIGILGTPATLAADLYQEKLRSQGFDVTLPDIATMEHAVIPGIAALQRRDMEGARNLLRIAVQVLLVNAVNMVLLACHNTPTAFSADDPVLRKCIDPIDALARATVKWSQSIKRAS